MRRDGQGLAAAEGEGNFSTWGRVLPSDGEIGYHTGATTEIAEQGASGRLSREP